MEPKSKLLRSGWFRRQGEDLELLGSRCESCNRYFFPPQKVCPECLSSESMKTVPLSKKGKLVSYTVIGIAAPEFKTPYAVAYVDLPEKIRLFSMLTECEPYDQKLQLDMDLEMVFGEVKKDEEGTSIISYKFRPMK